MTLAHCWCWDWSQKIFFLRKESFLRRSAPWAPWTLSWRDSVSRCRGGRTAASWRCWGRGRGRGSAAAPGSSSRPWSAAAGAARSACPENNGKSNIFLERMKNIFSSPGWVRESAEGRGWGWRPAAPCSPWSAGTTCRGHPSEDLNQEEVSINSTVSTIFCSNFHNIQTQKRTLPIWESAY